MEKIKCVIISLFTIFIEIDGNNAEENYTQFLKVLERYQDQIKTPVAVSSAHGSLDLCHAMAANGRKCASLNPSDKIAMKYGTLGMFWNRKIICVEEFIALRTTLLFGHWDVKQKYHLYR